MELINSRCTLLEEGLPNNEYINEYEKNERYYTIIELLSKISTNNQIAEYGNNNENSEDDELIGYNQKRRKLDLKKQIYKYIERVYLDYTLVESIEKYGSLDETGTPDGINNLYDLNNPNFVLRTSIWSNGKKTIERFYKPGYYITNEYVQPHMDKQKFYSAEGMLQKTIYYYKSGNVSSIQQFITNKNISDSKPVVFFYVDYYNEDGTPKIGSEDGIDGDETSE